MMRICRSAAEAPSAIRIPISWVLWFTEYDANQIGRITTAGAITEYPVPTANSEPQSITAGPDGALWFTEYGGNKIGRITTAGVITEYPVPSANSDLTGRRRTPISPGRWLATCKRLVERYGGRIWSRRYA